MKPRTLRVLTWNLFHGRDFPPDPALLTLRSRLWRLTEVNATHAQVNRPLLREFAGVLAGDPWQVALLQEAPPRWLRPLCRHCGAGGVSALTSRNLGAAPRARLAELNPDLVASGEGGSNQLLVRPPWRIDIVRRLTLTRRPERRVMLWARLCGPGGARLAFAGLHASAGDPPAAAREIELGASRAVEWAAGDGLVFGGDLNLRPVRTPAPFEEMRSRHGLMGVTEPRGIDHLLHRRLMVVEPARALPPEWREVEGPGGRAIRLSDHAAVSASYLPLPAAPEVR